MGGPERRPRAHLSWKAGVPEISGASEGSKGSEALLWKVVLGALHTETLDVFIPFGRAAAEALGKIGPPAEASASRLIELLKHRNAYVRLNAAYALGAMGPTAKAAVPALTEELKIPEYIPASEAAAEALGKIGVAGRQALIEALKDTEPWLFVVAADALAKIGPDAKAAVPALIEAVKDNVESVRSRAAYTLGKIGPEAKAAVPALIEVLKDENENVRRNAAEALRIIGTPEAQKALEEYRQ